MTRTLLLSHIARLLFSAFCVGTGNSHPHKKKKQLGLAMQDYMM